MPFRKKLEDIYRKGIKETLESLNWTCGRSKEKFDTPEIVCTICKNAQEAVLIIADLTGMNPNVFLEVGLAFGLEKYVALLSQDSKDIPFDARTFRTIIYDPLEIEDLKEKISALVKSIEIRPRPPNGSTEAKIEKQRIRRVHSEKINDGALKPWLEKVADYCKIKVVYSKELDKMIALRPNDPTDLDYFYAAKSHLESKYPEVIEAWEEFKHVTFEHNKELVLLFEKIRMLVIKELNLPLYYSSLYGKTPQEHVTVDRFIENIYQEMRFRLERNEKWYFGQPKITPFISGKKKFFRLAWGSYSDSVTSSKESTVKKAMALIDRIAENSEFKEAVKNLRRHEDEIYKKKQESFKAKIKDVTDSIELGRILEGKCRFCSSTGF